MNEYSERDLGETRTRRAMLATAGGLLLPAGLLALDEEDAEATKRAKRRRRRKPASWGANDVIINFRNATSETLRFRYININSGDAGFTALDPGKESGFAANMKPENLTMKCILEIRFSQIPDLYSIRCANYDIGWPDAEIWWYRDSKDHRFDIISGSRNMGEDTTFEITHRGYRIHVHRWTNGKEPLDNNKEWYTRFFVTMSNV
jgi:hypothetical protein